MVRYGQILASTERARWTDIIQARSTWLHHLQSLQPRGGEQHLQKIGTLDELAYYIRLAGGESDVMHEVPRILLIGGRCNCVDGNLQPTTLRTNVGVGPVGFFLAGGSPNLLTGLFVEGEEGGFFVVVVDQIEAVFVEDG